MASQYGRVITVNLDARYLVVECAVLPKEGEELTLSRENSRSGRVRINRHISGNVAAADILEGSPAIGDSFYVMPAGSKP